MVNIYNPYYNRVHTGILSIMTMTLCEVIIAINLLSVLITCVLILVFRVPIFKACMAAYSLYRTMNKMDSKATNNILDGSMLDGVQRIVNKAVKEESLPPGEFVITNNPKVSKKKRKQVIQFQK